MLLILPSNAEPSINVRLVPSIGSAAKLNVDSELPPLIIRVVASESLANLSAAWVRATDFEAPTVTSSVSKLSIVATLASPLNDNLMYHYLLHHQEHVLQYQQLQLDQQHRF